MGLVMVCSWIWSWILGINVLALTWRMERTCVGDWDSGWSWRMDRTGHDI